MLSLVLENVSRDCTPTHSTTSTSGYSTTQLFVPVEVQLENEVILYNVFGLEESIAGSVPPSASSKYSNNNNSGESSPEFVQQNAHSMVTKGKFEIVKKIFEDF